MINLAEDIKEKIAIEGFAIIDDVFSSQEILSLLNAILNADNTRPTFRKTNDLFAIRQFLKEVPEAIELIFNNNLNSIISDLFGNDYFAVKSIFFDKSENSNWFVAYHQDLTISVDRKIDIEGFGPWTIKQNQFGVQPPLDILKNNFTIRIHLDDTDENNGALKVIPGSHERGIYRPKDTNWLNEKEIVCRVKRGGIMIMRPLLLHSSGRTINNNKRRVIHIEFSSALLPSSLNWSELINWPLRPTPPFPPFTDFSLGIAHCLLPIRS